LVEVGTERPKLEVAEVLRLYWGESSALYAVSYEQRRAARDMRLCRTAALGGHVDICPECSYVRISYNPCDNRHCPKCQAFERAE
jgi:hypothetical protein